jgi:streptogramin lyase
MVAITEWADCMPSTVTLEAFSDRDDYGKPSYAAAVSYKARVIYQSKMIVGQGSGEAANLETTANGVVWFGPPTANPSSTVPPDVTVEDRITLPDGSTPNIMRVDQFQDEEGDHHTKVYFR